ncbi:TetR/AcrR family transcriptional regulator [Enterococcus faecalis]|uniref:TetR/AcrR family transcriptional regulator n=1 Tax=Enterococcus faecalis TaxID=1351 RepID=UPI0032DF1592
MAVKDHSLDDKIIKAAFDEFMEFGFRKASIRKIADRAGVTPGAIYTRYDSKDALFYSLVSNFLSAVKVQSKPLGKMYYDIQQSRNVNALMEAIRKEENIYLDILFKYYDECILFFCRSEGSSVYDTIQNMMEHKAAVTVAFLKGMSQSDIDLDGIGMIMGEQFHYYRQILEKGYSKEKAVSCMKTVETFLEAGWKDLFEKILQG